MDCYGKKAGKGALIQEELSGTLGVSQDQYLFTPLNPESLQDGGAFLRRNLRNDKSNARR